MGRCTDDLGTPLADVTFCVLDLETTGGDPSAEAITEVGAVKVRGGECVGTFQTLVNPGCAVPPSVTVLTGIAESMVVTAPRIEQVLPTLLEFVAGSVVVGHNVRFDLAFLAAALGRAGYPRLGNRWVDTCALARCLVGDEVANCRLGTIAASLRLDHRPTHRALEDAFATVDLLHLLLERVGSLGITSLDDLLGLPTIHGHRQLAKLRLTAALPRRPGVYLFRDDGGRVLHVGTATNVRAQVRSYFAGGGRGKVGSLLRATAAIDHVECSTPLEAAVMEVRLIHQLRPRDHRPARSRREYAYLKLTLAERFPRLTVVADARDDGALYLGPLPSRRIAKLATEAIETVVPLRRCTDRPPKQRRPAPCAPAQLGVATCPCAGAISEADYTVVVGRAVRGLTVAPALLLDPLDERMRRLAAAARFEEAADLRARGQALAGALHRQRRFDALRRSGRTVVEVPGLGGAELDGGRLLRAWSASSVPAGAQDDGADSAFGACTGTPTVAVAQGEGDRPGGTGSVGAGAAAAVRASIAAARGDESTAGGRSRPAGGRRGGDGGGTEGTGGTPSTARRGTAVRLPTRPPLALQRRGEGGDGDRSGDGTEPGRCAGAVPSESTLAAGTHPGARRCSPGSAVADPAAPSARGPAPTAEDRSGDRAADGGRCGSPAGEWSARPAAPPPAPPPLPPLPGQLADELACVVTWLDGEAARIRLLHSDGGIAHPLPVLRSFEPGRGGWGGEPPGGSDAVRDRYPDRRERVRGGARPPPGDGPRQRDHGRARRPGGGASQPGYPGQADAGTDVVARHADGSSSPAPTAAGGRGRGEGRRPAPTTSQPLGVDATR